MPCGAVGHMISSCYTYEPYVKIATKLIDQLWQSSQLNSTYVLKVILFLRLLKEAILLWACTLPYRPRNGDEPVHLPPVNHKQKRPDMLTLNTPDAIETGVSFLNPVWTYCNQYQTLLQRYAAMGTAAVSPQSDKKFPNGGKICVKSVTTKKDLAATVKTNLPLVKPTMTVNHSNNNNSIGNKSSPPRFQCSDCSRSYSTFSGLSKHKQFHCVLQQKKQFGCKFCEKQYSSLG
uniref:C2H2-type domain-containing protein n=1 Tax=Romanomermis culicivorax TaxID=13658 RepID=A0A915J900_ROMCU